MAQRSGLFDSTEIVESINGYPRGNRAETADFFAKYFSNFISNGVYAKPATNYQVTASGGMTVNIKPGSCFINGYMAWDAESENHDITTDGASHDHYLIQRLYLPDGTITKTWLIDPDITTLPVRTATTHDLIIAMVRVPANAREITDSMITDYRYDAEKCGIVHGTVEQLDTTDLAHQLNAAAQEYIAAAENSLVTWQGNFDQWFEAVKNQLSGDAATALEANKMARAYTYDNGAAELVNRSAALAGYYLSTGQTVYVNFINSVPMGATLNVNSTGAIPIYNGDSPISDTDIPAGTVAALLYDGTRYILLNPAVPAKGVIYITAQGASDIAADTDNGIPMVITVGDRFSLVCANGAAAGATLNINNTGAYPIVNNYTGAPIVLGDIPSGYTADITFNGTEYILLNPLIVSGTPSGYAFYTADSSFKVPDFVTAIKISACAAGIGRYAGEYLIDQIYSVTPGETIELTIGKGNTVIGTLATLIAGTVSAAVPTTKLGYAAGYNGGNEYTASNIYGFGGAYGFGGGGSVSGLYNTGGGGAGIGGAGGNGGTSNSSGGNGGGTTGGNGGTPTSAAGDAKSGKLIYKGADPGGNKGGDGSVYGAGGGGGRNSNTDLVNGGGAAGGYGAGGGGNSDKTYTADASGGMVLIEWGGMVA